MMYLPSIFSENMMDEFLNDFNRGFFGGKDPLYGKHASHLMKTDIREDENGFEIDVDMPGFKKDEIQLQLENGNLTISATKGLNKEESDKKTGRIIRQERYSGSMSRSFYVGDHLTEEDIKAKFEDGVLKLTVPKKEKQLPVKRTIAIEG